MIKCKVNLNFSYGNYPHRVGGVSEEEWQIIKNFLNSVSCNAMSEVGYSPCSGGDSVNDAEYKLLLENAELLGVEFIEEPHTNDKM